MLVHPAGVGLGDVLVYRSALCSGQGLGPGIQFNNKRGGDYAAN